MKADNKVGTLQGLTRDKISDSLVARVKHDNEGDRFEINDDVEEHSDDDFNDEWISASGPEREYIGRSFDDVAVGEEDKYKHGKVVDVVKSDSFNGVYFQYYNHRRCPATNKKCNGVNCVQRVSTMEKESI